MPDNKKISHISDLKSNLRMASWLEDGEIPMVWRNPQGTRFVFVGGEGGDIPLHGTDRHVTGLLSEALLEAAIVGRRTNALPVAVVILKRISPLNRERVERFMNRVAANQAWVLADIEGRFLPHIPGDNTLKPVNLGSTPQQHPKLTRHNLFTDLNQWLSKVLIAAQLPPGLVNAPRQSIRNASILAEVAGVSVPGAARFVRALKAEGALDTTHGEIRISNPEHYLQEWKDSLASARLHPYRQDVSAQFVQGPATRELTRSILKQEAMRTPQKSDRPHFWMLGGLFTACDALGLGFVEGAPATLIVSSLDSESLQARGIVLEEKAGKGSLLLRVPTYPESVRRGSVFSSGIRVTDVLQCWLDASLHKLRGEEQASFIWGRALGPAFKAFR